MKHTIAKNLEYPNCKPYIDISSKAKSDMNTANLEAGKIDGFGDIYHSIFYLTWKLEHDTH